MVVAHFTAPLGFNPCATESTYCLLAISAFKTGAVDTCPVVVEIFVKTPVDGVVDPIGDESSVLLVICSPLCCGFTVA